MRGGRSNRGRGGRGRGEESRQTAITTRSSSEKSNDKVSELEVEDSNGSGNSKLQKAEQEREEDDEASGTDEDTKQPEVRDDLDWVKLQLEQLQLKIQNMSTGEPQPNSPKRDLVDTGNIINKQFDEEFPELEGVAAKSDQNDQQTHQRTILTPLLPS
ncbi:unnamed protein product [Amaranthus hypochondriacus]